MTFRKLYLLAAFGVVVAATGSWAWADPPRTPITPAPQIQRTPPLEPPLRPTDRRLPALNLSPVTNLIILAALGWWLWRLQSRRRREEKLFRASYYDRLPLHQGTLRAVKYPSEAQVQKLSKYRDQWIDEFKGVQNAWYNRDLRSAAAIVGPEVMKELEDGARGLKEEPAEGKRVVFTQLKINLADPADSWEEAGKEFVTVHFAGQMRDPRSDLASEFDEFWTYSRALSESGAGAESGTPWVVTAIRRGNRERSLPRLANQKGG